MRQFIKEELKDAGKDLAREGIQQGVGLLKDLIAGGPPNQQNNQPVQQPMHNWEQQQPMPPQFGQPMQQQPPQQFVSQQPAQPQQAHHVVPPQFHGKGRPLNEIADSIMQKKHNEPQFQMGGHEAAH